MTDPFLNKFINNRLINVKDYIISNYVKMGLNEQSAMLLLHIYNLSENGYNFLSVNLLKEKMSIDFVSCADLVLKLVESNLIAFDIVVDDNGKTKEKFNLSPLYNKILKDLLRENDDLKKENIENDTSLLISIIENEFGRTLSSFELQIIASWINDYNFDINLIKLALKEAMLSRAYNLKYIDRILLTWKQNNINTVEKAKEYTKTYKRFDVKKESLHNDDQEVYVSWMK